VLKLTYAPPTITSPANAGAGSPHTLAFTAVGGATGYKWNRWNLVSAPVENCESTANITSATTGTYSVLCTSLKQQGTTSFHLENSVSPAASQSIQLNGLYYGQALSSISFQSRIRYATTAEQFKVQVKEEGGFAWQDVYSQSGNGTDAEAGFTLRSASLTAMAGKAFRVRFVLSYTPGGSYFGGYSGDNVGWLIDAISFTNVSTLQNNANQALAGTSGSFTPSAGTYLMSVAPVISSRDFPASYQTLTVTVPVLPVITTQPAPVTINSGATATLTAAASGTSPAFQWYEGVSGVTTSPVAGAVSASFTTPALTASKSYWVRATNAAGTADSNAALVTVNDPYTSWALILESANGLPAGTISNPGGDADRDGRSNLIEYAFGTSPVVGNEPTPRMPVNSLTATHFVVRYQRDVTLTSLTFTPQTCPVLGNWKAPGQDGAPAGFTDTVVSTVGTLETREAKLPLSSGSTCFIRIQVTRP